MQRLTEMHKSHAPESLPCLPGGAAALSVPYHHLVSPGCNPSPIPSPPTVGLSQIRDENSGECFRISRTDFICFVLIDLASAEWCRKGMCPLWVCCPQKERNIRLCRGPHISYIHLAFEPMGISSYFVPRHSCGLHTTAAPRGQGGERKKGIIWPLSAEIHTLPRLALKQVSHVGTD